MKMERAFKKAFKYGTYDVDSGVLVNASHTYMLKTAIDLDLIVSDVSMDISRREVKMPASLTGPTGIATCMNVDCLIAGLECLRSLGVENVAIVTEPKHSFPMRIVDLGGKHMFVIAPRILEDMDEIDVVNKHTKDSILPEL